LALIAQPRPAGPPPTITMSYSMMSRSNSSAYAYAADAKPRQLLVLTLALGKYEPDGELEHDAERDKLPLPALFKCKLFCYRDTSRRELRLALRALYNGNCQPTAR